MQLAAGKAGRGEACQKARHGPGSGKGIRMASTQLKRLLPQGGIEGCLLLHRLRSGLASIAAAAALAAGLFQLFPEVRPQAGGQAAAAASECQDLLQAGQGPFLDLQAASVQLPRQFTAVLGAPQPTVRMAQSRGLQLDPSLFGKVVECPDDPVARALQLLGRFGGLDGMPAAAPARGEVALNVAHAVGRQGLF